MVIKGVRFSYLQVFEAVARLGAEPKFSVSIIIPKTNSEALAEFDKAFKAAVDRGQSKKLWGDKLPAGFKTPLRDGDERDDADPAYAGCWFFNASAPANRPPGVYKLLNGKAVPASPGEVYSGCWGMVHAELYPYNVSGSKGVGVGLVQLLKDKDGESLGGLVAATPGVFGVEVGEPESGPGVFDLS